MKRTVSNPICAGKYFVLVPTEGSSYSIKSKLDSSQHSSHFTGEKREAQRNYI